MFALSEVDLSRDKNEKVWLLIIVGHFVVFYSD